MSPKLKKWIIATVVILIVAVGTLAVFSVLSKLSTATVHDLRIVEAGTKEEIFQKEVYLTAKENNNFKFDLSVSSTSRVMFTAESSDNSVADIEYIDGSFQVNFFKKGTATINVYVAEERSISDSFVLIVRENYPLDFKIVDEKADARDEVSVFADNKKYEFEFNAGALVDNSFVNNETLSVVDDYNKSVFESVYIDSATSKLVVIAKQSITSLSEFVTISCKTSQDEDADNISFYIVKINVKGNYVSDMQLVLSSQPNFENAIYVCGNGKLAEGEKRVSFGDLVFTDNVNIVYAKVRIVFTNGDMFDVTKDASSSGNELGTIKPPPSVDYYQIQIGTTLNITFRYSKNGQEKDQSFIFYYYDLGSSEYNNFLENRIYKKVVNQSGQVIYEYAHWDERYKRDDVVTYNGEIIGFKNGNPACGSISESGETNV